jgi:hypothetical protein
MRILLRVSAFTLLFGINSALGQTASDFEKAYGKSLVVYSISEHIWMTPEYAADGQVCSMRLYPKHIEGNINYVSNSAPFQFKELKAILNKLVPPQTRGLQNESFGQTATGGPAAWTTYRYERVTFTFVSPFGPLPYDGKTIRKGEFTFSVDYVPGEQPARSRLPTADDFSEFQSGDTQIVTIKWNDRECALN